MAKIETENFLFHNNVYAISSALKRKVGKRELYRAWHGDFVRHGATRREAVTMVENDIRREHYA